MSQKNTVLGDIRERPGYLTIWERHRHAKLHWFVECFAEALGVFFYVYAGVGSTAAYIIGGFAGQAGLGSLLQIGFGYAFGILLAISVCAGTSGGHFNPCITIAFVLFKGFPKLKAVRYIIAQILGAFIACLIIHAQWADLIAEVNLGLEAKGVLSAIQFTPQGTGGILGLYVTPGSNLGRVFLNEFVVDMFLAWAIWACLDPTNLFVPPAAAPWVISFAYAAAIWGYSPIGLAANSARDIGGRLANMALYGTKASGGTYAAIAALTNIPATLIAIIIYEFLLADSDRVIPKAQMEVMRVHMGHKRLGHEHAQGHTNRNQLGSEGVSGYNADDDDKAHTATYENARV